MGSIILLVVIGGALLYMAAQGLAALATGGGLTVFLLFLFLQHLMSDKK